MGHHWTFDNYLRKALSENSLPFKFINPNADMASAEDQFGSEYAGSYLQVSERDYIEQAIASIGLDIRSNKYSKILILIPWAPQYSLQELEGLNAIEELVETSYAAITILTSAFMRGEGGTDNRHQYEEFFGTKSRHILWVGQLPELSNSSNANLRAIPDYAETRLLSGLSTNYDLSFFGQLSSYRGLFEIFIIALFNPSLKVRVKGYGFSKHRIFRPWKYRFFRYHTWRSNFIAALLFSLLSLPLNLIRLMPNLQFSPFPFESETELDCGLSETKAVFYCPKLPHGSGLTNKSLAAGIPILWNGRDGQAFRLLRESYPSGYFKYWHIFVPNKIRNQVRNLPKLDPHQSLMWNHFKVEIGNVRKFIE